MSFDNCTEAYLAGYANIPAGSPMYAKKLDRDHDGTACDQPPAGFKPHQQTQTGTKMETSVGVGAQLPKTGPAAEIGGAGAVMLVVGIAVAAVFRRRRTRFTA